MSDCPCGKQHEILNSYRQAKARQNYDQTIWIGDRGEAWLCENA